MSVMRIMDKEKILNCEIEYSKCFSKTVERQNIIRFSDDLLKDMYYHNFTLIKGIISDDELLSCIKDELLLRKGLDFCNIVSYIPISDYILQKVENKPEVTVNGFYLFDITTLQKLSGKEGSVIFKVIDDTMTDDILRLDIEHDGDNLGVDFCTRRVNRRKKVYLSNEGVNSYVLYDKSTPL